MHERESKRTPILERIKPYEQKVSCGPASLFIIYRAFGLEKTEKEIASEMELTKAGGSGWGELVKHAKKMAFKVLFRRNTTLNELWLVYGNDLPIIVGWMAGDEEDLSPHFSVVKALSEETIKLVDPRYSEYTNVPFTEFGKRWRDDEVSRGILIFSKERKRVRKE